jgi:hypothetical protein
MMQRPSPKPTPCSERGHLIEKSGCYALRREDGTETWLELDAIPHHLIDSFVQLSGRRFASELIEVNAIGPG